MHAVSADAHSALVFDKRLKVGSDKWSAKAGNGVDIFFVQSASPQLAGLNLRITCACSKDILLQSSQPQGPDVAIQGNVSFAVLYLLCLHAS